jgi:hypothetical protein
MNDDQESRFPMERILMLQKYSLFFIFPNNPQRKNKFCSQKMTNRGIFANHIGE